jgi:propionate CoA-transferase
MYIRVKDDIVALRRLLEERCKKIGKRVGVFINYDSFRISEDTYDDYADMDRYMLEHYYTTITRFATSAFMRMKLGEAFTRRSIAPHVFEKKEDAQAFLDSLDLQEREAS